MNMKECVKLNLTRIQKHFREFQYTSTLAAIFFSTVHYALASNKSNSVFKKPALAKHSYFLAARNSTTVAPRWAPYSPALAPYIYLADRTPCRRKRKFERISIPCSVYSIHRALSKLCMLDSANMNVYRVQIFSWCHLCAICIEFSLVSILRM